VTKNNIDRDPVVDYLLGRDVPRLSPTAALGLTFVSCLVLAAVVAAGVLWGSIAFGACVAIVVVVSWWSSPATAVVLAGVAFLFANGFVFDSAGTLVWHGDTDVVRLALLVCLAIIGSLLGHHHVDLRANSSRIRKEASASHQHRASVAGHRIRGVLH
jgi:K+-sensing histidine kinase KdpD